MNSRNIFIASVAIIAIATGTWLSYRVMTPPPLPQTATVLPAPVALPAFRLLDQDGDEFGADSFRGYWNLVFFGFTHCPDVCPLTLQTLAAAKQQLQTDGQDPLPRIVLVSVDPERDTPDVMRDYVEYFGAGNVGVTGELDELRKLTGALGIYFEKHAGSDGEYSVDHSAVVLLIDPDGRFHAVFGAPHESNNFVHDLPIIMAQR